MDSARHLFPSLAHLPASRVIQSASPPCHVATWPLRAGVACQSASPRVARQPSGSLPCSVPERVAPALRVIQSAWPPLPEVEPNEREGSPVGLSGAGRAAFERNGVFGGDPSRSLWGSQLSIRLGALDDTPRARRGALDDTQRGQAIGSTRGVARRRVDTRRDEAVGLTRDGGWGDDTPRGAIRRGSER